MQDITFNINNNFNGKYLRFEISSKSNVAWNNIKWDPIAEYTNLNGNDTIINCGVRYNIYKKITNTDGKFKTFEFNGVVYPDPELTDDVIRDIIITPELNIGTLSTNKIVMVVKGVLGNRGGDPMGDKWQVIGRKNLSYINGELSNYSKVPLTSVSNQTDVDAIYAWYNQLASFQIIDQNLTQNILTLGDDNSRFISFGDDIPGRETASLLLKTVGCSRILVEYYSEDKDVNEYLTNSYNSSTNCHTKFMSWCEPNTANNMGISTPTYAPDPYHNNQIIEEDMVSNIFTLRTNDDYLLGSMWRGWGVFQYSGAAGRWAVPINEWSLFIHEDREYIKDIGLVSLHPDIKTKKYWEGLNKNLYIDGSTISVGRLFDLSLFDLTEASDADGPLRANEETIDNLYEISNAPILTAINDSKSFWGGASLNLGVTAGLSGSHSSGDGSVTVGFMDMNGDGYPDRITEDSVEFSSARGGRDSEITSIINETSSNLSYSFGVNAGPSNSASPFALSSGIKDIKTAELVNNITNASISVNISAAINENRDISDIIYSDINGDGLPDMLYKENNTIKAKLNLGYSFSLPTDWGFAHQVVQGGKSQIQASVGIGASWGTWGAGIQGGKSSSMQLYALRDMNGDGLADQLYCEEILLQDGSLYQKKFYVAYNLGNSFSPLLECEAIENFQKSESYSLSENLGGTIGAGAFGVKMVITASKNNNDNVGLDLFDIQDIDGDGLPDLLESGSTPGELLVKRSVVGCTNKLKSVYNPLGGTFTLNYDRSKATYNHPGGKWIMKSVLINDGIDDDGEMVKNEFEYEGGKRDRREQEFLGFAKVATKNINTSANNEETYRTITQLFDTTNTYTKGALLASSVIDNNGNKYSQNENEYYTYCVTKRVDNGSYHIWEDTPTDQSIVYAPLKYTKSKQYNGSDSIVTAETFSEYNIAGGNHGELIKYKFSDKGSLGNNGSGPYNYQTIIEYTSTVNPNSFYVYGLPKKVTVKDSDGKIYKEVSADWTCDWRLLNQVKEVYADGTVSATDWKYNTRGNILKKLYPANANGERYVLNYDYDNILGMYVIQITDTFGYTTKLQDYDYRFGIPRRTIDINGNIMLTELDNLGRITSVTGPNETAASKPYTIKFEYFPGSMTKNPDGTINNPAYAVSKHYDPEHTGDSIETVTFVDGFGRPVQVKKDAVVDGVDKMIVSGRMKYDAFGRTTRSYYPTIDELTNRTVFKRDSDTYKTINTYDALDRVLTSTLPDGTSSQMQYAIADGKLKTTVIDAEGGKQETFANGSGKTVKTVQYSNVIPAQNPSPDSILTTLFEYDAINRLKKVTDNAGKITESWYDLAGRRTQVSHPASGITRFHYDPAGNMTSKVTANKDSIIYEYEFNRLKEIKYPRYPENNVSYTYGSADDNSDFNRKGRLVYQEDGSGGQEFKYGKQGELTELRRTMVIPNQAVATYVTQWDYDSWNRLQTMTYPDGEAVNYHYNKGGLLTSVGSTATKYVKDIKYDKFEQRTYLKYGNNAETNYTYDSENRQLNNLSVVSGSNTLMNNAYEYDDVSNVTKITNTGSVANGIGGNITHEYGYDKLYRLTSASGDFVGDNGKKAKYGLTMRYDNMHNITYKKQEVVQEDIKFDGILNAGYELSYNYADNSQQIANIADISYRADRGTSGSYALGKLASDSTTNKTQQYSYDANGNMLYIATGTKKNDTTLLTSSSRQLLWDEENRLLAVSDNGYVSNYWYDAAGERTVKQSGGSEGVLVNGVTSAARTETTKFTAYISPYLVVSNGGNYSKHIYMGSQRITSKLSSSDIFAESPVNDTLQAKYDLQTANIKSRFDSLGVAYSGEEQTGGLVSLTPPLGGWGAVYFYHSDHLGSSSLITDGTGALVQHIEYVPFGEVFVDERNSSWSTPYLFNGKERDEETGLYYYGARYYDSRTSVWLSVDPLAEKYMNISSYVYCADNPVKFVDPDGKEPREGNNVLKIDINSCRLTRINDAKPKSTRYDKHLFRFAANEQAYNLPFGPGMPSKIIETALLVIDFFDLESVNNQFKQTNLAHSWLQASQSSTGYSYVEFSDRKNIRRQVENLNKKLGVEKGFENVVTHKQTLEGKSDQLIKEDIFSYRSEKTKDGKTKVMYQQITIDFTKSGREGYSVSGWIEAKPSQYEPNKE